MKTDYTTGPISVALVVIVGATPAPAQQTDSSKASTRTNAALSVEEIARLNQNPVSELREVDLGATIGRDVPNSGKTSGTYTIQVVWPFSLNEDWRLISYTILPLIQAPVPHENTIVGLSSTLVNLFVAPKRPGKLVWGAGPALLLPTRTDSDLPSDRLGLGPALVLYYPQKMWNAGVLLQNVWSLGGAGINEVNAFGAQYSVTYNLPRGWFLFSNSTITANWTTSDSNRWTVPVGGGFGAVFKLGKQAMSLSFQVFSSPIKPRSSPRTTTASQFSLLFP